MKKTLPSSLNALSAQRQGRVHLTLAALGTLALASQASAQVTYDWQGTTGGSFETAVNWTPAAAGSTFTNVDSVLLTKDFTAATWTLDAAVTLNKLTYEDTGATADVAGIIDAGTGGSLTLGGSTPGITVNNSLTINADLSGTAGLTKTGIQPLTLSGNNAGLSGTLNIADVAGTNNAGVVVTSLPSLGGITTVTVNGTSASGGYFRLAGTTTGGISVPSTVTFNLTGAGGNSAPTGTLISSGTGVNTIAGTINVLNNTVRISNSGATRFDITGPIIASGSNGVTFRQASNEGVHLTNTSNAWTGLTTHSGGVLWFEPGTLPNANLQHAASDPGSIQTSGSFTRALGTGAGQMFSTYLQAGNRETGFSARGGALTVNLGGAGADVVFYNFQSLTGTRTSASAVITGFTNTTGYVTGMVVSGTGIPANATITAVTANTITISAAATAAGTTAVVGSTQNNARWQTNVLNLNWDQADSKLTFVNNLDLNGFSRDISVRANVAEISGIIKNGLAGTAAGIRKLGNNGTLTLSGNNTFTGGVDISAGNVRITNSGALGTGAKTISLTNGTAGNPALLLNGSSGAIDLPANMSFNTSNTVTATSASVINEAGNNTIRGNFTITSGGGGTRIASQAGKLTLTGNLTPNVTGRTLDFIGAGDIEVTGTIANGSTVALPVSKRDSGILTLSGNNSYTGATTLEGGTTLVNGTLANTPVTIKTGATLGGNGTIGGGVTLEGGGIIAPGTSPGILTMGSLVTTGAGSLNIEINGLTPGTQHDQLSISSVGGGAGTFDLSLGTTVLNLSLGFTPALNDKFFLVLNDGSDSILGNLYNGATMLNQGDFFSAAGQNWQINYQDNGDAGSVGNDISLTVVPEATAPALSVLGLGFLLSRRRRSV